MLLPTTLLSFVVVAAAAASSTHETMTHSQVVKDRVLHNTDCLIKANGSMTCANFCGQGLDYVANVNLSGPQQYYYKCEVIGCSSAPECIANGGLPHGFTNLYLASQDAICNQLCDNAENYVISSNEFKTGDDIGDNAALTNQNGAVSPPTTTAPRLPNRATPINLTPTKGPSKEPTNNPTKEPSTEPSKDPSYQGSYQDPYQNSYYGKTGGKGKKHWYTPVPTPYPTKKTGKGGRLRKS